MLKVKISGKVDEMDFVKLVPHVDRMINSHGSIDFLIDATAFYGWSDMQDAKKHFDFVREHQMKIGRIALIAGDAWQHWIAGAVSVFVHPEISVFEPGHLLKARTWLRE